MADYTAFVEAGNALVELLRDRLTPEPLDNRETISLCSPHESENNQLTLYLYHIEESNQPMNAGYRLEGRDTMRIPPAEYSLHFLATAHSKAPAQLKEADQYRIMGALAHSPEISIRFIGRGAGTASYSDGTNPNGTAFKNLE